MNHYVGPHDPARAETWARISATAEAAQDGKWGSDPGPALTIAIAIEIDHLKDSTFDERLRLGLDGSEFLSCHVDDLLYGGKYCRETFAVLARVIAVLSYQPGGVYAFGKRWCARPVAESAAETWPEGPQHPWVHPDAARQRLLARWVGEDWTLLSGLVGEYRVHGWSPERLDHDLGVLRTDGQIEPRQGTNQTQWRRKPEKVQAPKPVQAPPEAQARISELQRKIPHTPPVLRTRDDFRRSARWWELEARRGYESTERSLWYAARMRWAAERRSCGLVAPWDPVLDGEAVPEPEGLT